MVSLKAERNSLINTSADTVTYFVFENAKTFKQQISFLKKTFRSISPALDAEVFTGKFQETLTLFPGEKRVKLLLVGLGKREELVPERLRRGAATAIKASAKLKAKSLSLVAPDQDAGKDWQILGEALADGVLLSLYKYNKYISDKKKDASTIGDVSVICDNDAQTKEISKGLAMARILCDATCFARDLGNAPANELFPESLAQLARACGRKNGFSVTVFDERKIKQLKMGGVLAVAKGSDKPPRFLILEYGKSSAGKGTFPPMVLVGKGVTFDAGGISIKPAAGMGEMKMDMCGAAAVIAAMQAAAQLKLPVHLIGLIPSVENLLGGSAMKPGDIITHYNGKTSEVDNTDAEGRLILADALSYASRYKPAMVIDLATLTGHVVVGLGSYATGMMGNDDEIMERLKQAGERMYERVWQLPMFEEYEKLNKSDVADVKNSGGRPAGAISAGFFLKQFIGDYKWVHLDIAGTAILNESLDYIPKGASGVGVRLVTDFLRMWTQTGVTQ